MCHEFAASAEDKLKGLLKITILGMVVYLVPV
jgi:hypothetical protein